MFCMPWVFVKRKDMTRIEAKIDQILEWLRQSDETQEVIDKAASGLGAANDQLAEQIKEK